MINFTFGVYKPDRKIRFFGLEASSNDRHLIIIFFPNRIALFIYPEAITVSGGVRFFSASIGPKYVPI